MPGAAVVSVVVVVSASVVVSVVVSASVVVVVVVVVSASVVVVSVVVVPASVVVVVVADGSCTQRICPADASHRTADGLTKPKRRKWAGRVP